MKLLVDMNLSPAWVDSLRASGTLARDYSAEVAVTIPARGRTWVTVSER